MLREALYIWTRAKQFNIFFELVQVRHDENPISAVAED